MQNNLQISELRYRRLFETAQDGILLIDFKTGMILDVNKFLINMLGYSKKDLLKKYLWEIGVFKDIAASKKNFEILQKKKYVRFENLPLETKTGKKIDVEFVANAYHVGNRIFIQCNIRDITDRVVAEKSLQNSEILFRELFENISSGVAVYDVKNNGNDFIIKKFNKSAEKIENIKKEKIIGKNLLEIFPGVKKFGLYKVFKRVWKTGIPENFPVSFYTDERISGWRENYIYKLPNGDIAAIYNDVTKSKEAEEKIQWLATYPTLTPRPIVEIDKKQGIVYANPAAQKIFPDLENKKTNHPFVSESIKCFSKLDCFTKNIDEHEVKIDDHWYLQTFYLVNPNRLRIYANDITELKISEERIKELNDRNKAVIESIGDGVFACDKKGNILLFNKIIEKMIGIPVKKAINNHYSKVISFVKENGKKPDTDFIVEAINYNKIIKMTNHIFLVKKDGNKIPVANSAAPIKNIKGEIIGCVVILHEMTKEYEIDKAKTEFVSLASHQMRTPLTIINWYVEALQSKRYGFLNNRQSEFASEIQNASRRMTHLVGSLLNVSRLEMGTFVIEPKNLNIISLAKNAVKIFKSQIKTKNLIFNEKYDSNLKIFFGDSELLNIVLQNLLSNSVKYTPYGGEINFFIKKEKDLVKITVSDTGIGIPSGQQHKIFEKLFRADNVRIIDPNGTGLGLYIVYEIVNHSGGKIWFESAVGKGTTFYVTFPSTGMVKKEGYKKILL